MSAAAPWPDEAASLKQCLTLALLLHILIVLVVGTAPGGAGPAGGSPLWGAVNVRLRGVEAERPVVPALAPPLREVAPPPEAVPPQRALPREPLPPEPAPLVVPSREPATFPAPEPAPPVERSPAPSPEPAAAPLESAKPPEPIASQPLIEAPPLPVPPPRMEPVELPVPKPTELPMPKPVELAPQKPVIEAAPAPTAEPSPPAQAPARATPTTPSIEPGAARGTGAPDATAQPGALTVPAPPLPPASAPPLNLQLPRGFGSGQGTRGLLPLLPAPAERKSKLGEGIEKSARPDCRTAHSDKGLLAVVPLAADAISEKGCRW